MKNRTRIAHTFKTTINGKTEDIFPLLCPVREYEWLPVWQCEMIYSKSGYAELGCVFKTSGLDPWGDETWVVCTYLPNKQISFIRTSHDRTTRYEISLEDTKETTLISWTQEITALTENGDKLVAEYSYEEYQKLMVPLNQMLDHFVQTGKCLSKKL